MASVILCEVFRLKMGGFVNCRVSQAGRDPQGSQSPIPSEQPNLGKGTGKGSGLSHPAVPRREKLLSLQWGNSPAMLLTAVEGEK